MGKLIDREKSSKTLNKVKKKKNINTKQSFLQIYLAQKEVNPSQQLQRPCIWVTESVWIKGRWLLTEKLLEPTEPTLPPLEQEC